ncbi:hypothetical protein HDU93_004406 [Gonapodya sp. JEL0774]|nr:hypothetical protein HDU93_004406 [Gonapodya sp. JEL0774]
MRRGGVENGLGAEYLVIELLACARASPYFETSKGEKNIELLTSVNPLQLSDSSQSMTENKILVTGATGKIGQHVLKILSDQGANVTAFVRNPEKLSKEGIAGVKVASGDFSDSVAWKKAVRDHTHLFLLTNDIVREPDLVADAIAASPSLCHIVKISCIGADAAGVEPGTFIALHGAAEQGIARVIKESGNAGKVVVTYLRFGEHYGARELFQTKGFSHRPHDFMENIASNAATIKAHSSVFGACGQAAIASIAAQDIASVAATVLRSSQEERSKYADLGFTLTGTSVCQSITLKTVNLCCT